MIAIFESIGGFELMLVLVAALLVFGKDLPRVAAQAGAQFAKFRKGLDGAWKDSGMERELRQIKDAIPRDLSMTDVARMASDKLAMRLDEKSDATQGASQPQEPGAVPRGALEAPSSEVAAAPPSAVQMNGVDGVPAAEQPDATPSAPHPHAHDLGPSEDPRERERSGLHEGDRPIAR